MTLWAHCIPFTTSSDPASTNPALVSDVYLAWRKNATLPPAASALLAAIRAREISSPYRRKI